MALLSILRYKQSAVMLYFDNYCGIDFGFLLQKCKCRLLRSESDTRLLILSSTTKCKSINVLLCVNSILVLYSSVSAYCFYSSLKVIGFSYQWVTIVLVMILLGIELHLFPASLSHPSWFFCFVFPLGKMEEERSIC